MKASPLLLVPLILLSCQGPSPNDIHSDPSASVKTPDSAKTSIDSSRSGRRNAIQPGSLDSTRPARVDTPSTPMIAKNWTGYWKYEELFGGGSLNITRIKEDSFTFSMQVVDGGGGGEVEGSASLHGYHALYANKDDAGSPCRIEFTFEGDSIYVDQLEGICDAGVGVSYSGYYYKHPPKRPEETLLGLDMLDNETQDKKFRTLVGDDYKLFVESSQLVLEKEKDKDSLGAVVHQAAVKHLFTVRQNIILINNHLDIWAAVINGDTVYYYTNRPDYKHRIPKTIDTWREDFNDKPIVFK